MSLPYGPELRPIIKALDLSYEEIAERMGKIGNCEVTEQEVSDFLRSKGEPRAGFTIAFLMATGIKNVDPRSFGFGSNKKPAAHHE